MGVTYKCLATDVEPGDVLMLDDGLISMRVAQIQGSKIVCEVMVGGLLGSRKGLNLLGGGLSIPGIAGHDLRDIPRAAAMGVDYLAVSFPRSADDMNEARRLLREAGSQARLVIRGARKSILFASKTLLQKLTLSIRFSYSLSMTLNGEAGLLLFIKLTATTSP